ncbi:head GIN domain-containing protein [Hyalangium minutum]|uniref:Putative auto-transporter adhesin head GIN domain-containing protein n=1 Tax=Hyalangium minutum TaxID=394096 RepID=A0A085WLE6_9BACT|nr:head GIN domain-containing protein [Hyalangium minutum]KFE68509.1 hypothetical protein DB31_7746 [Hyalangium minutum]
MKTLRIALAVPTLLLATASFAEPSDTGATREVADFNGVEVSNGISAKVKVGPKSVRISGDEKRVGQVRTEVVDGKLVVQMEKKSWFGGGSSKGIEVTISNPQVTSVSASGGASIDAEASAANTFSAEASGGAVISVRNVDAKKVEVEVSGGGEATLKGRADTVDVEASGGAVVNAQELSHKSLDVEASGGTVVNANPTDRIEADLSGGCVVNVASAPAQREVESSGGSVVHYSKK